MGWIVICALRALGLARVSHLARKPGIAPGCPEMDTNNVRALFTHRLHVLRDYRRHVIQPVIRELVRNERKSAWSRSVSRLLIRHPKLLDDPARHRVAELLDRYVALRAVIDFRDRLQQVWDHTSASHESALVQWRALREHGSNSQIRALRTFALRLPKYVLSGRID